MNEEVKMFEITAIITRRLTPDECSKFNDIAIAYLDGLPDCKWQGGTMDVLDDT